MKLDHNEILVHYTRNDLEQIVQQYAGRCLTKDEWQLMKEESQELFVEAILFVEKEALDLCGVSEFPEYQRGFGWSLTKE